MEKLLLAAHVLAGILFVGPVAVTASLFPRFVPLAAGSLAALARRRTERDRSVALVLHGVTRRYGLVALTVPVVGLVLAAVQGRLGEVWITMAMVLATVAGGLLALRIVPSQSEALVSPPSREKVRVLMILTGLFNLLWAAIVVLMIVRPGAR